MRSLEWIQEAPILETTDDQRKLLYGLAHYIWWQTPEESLAWPERLLAQVMDIGTWEDECAIEEAFGEAVLSDVLFHAQPGWFRAKSWSFWFHRLRLIAATENPPPLPIRRYGA